MFEVTPDTWLISDTHFGHVNIIKYCNRPTDHNNIMIRNWELAVKDLDVILHLGDLAVWYGEAQDWWHQVAASLPGQKYLIRGNHDKKKDKVYESLGFHVIPEFVQEIKHQRVLFSHYPDELRTGSWDINVHGHIHNNEIDPRLAKTNRRYKNISVEVTNYSPVLASQLLTF